MHTSEIDEIRTVVLLQLLSRQVRNGKSFEEACMALMLTEDEILKCRTAMDKHGRQSSDEK